ncbi:quinone oxidoreductase [Gloeophyllum trabeum ATCC 11539]|uniref:Quinone oxidoreductase n=1 Tax=Gloeophyllum trabeum (strain ATCC 11539 / FP-39264 / Madison 617) TaxID=670483 RepID=S7RYX9_GLOTA|nr:quinone oxidoreductase [Gloeophyllum trabeum ATCC 11539]EPQ60170.1 quinone oxidoreductase [Gloeophyllum trabeum ATCC 11539]
MTSGQMKAIYFPEPGPASVLSLTEVPIPALETPYDILVQIKACALNPVDTKIRSGKFPAHPILGFDAAGVVEKAGQQALYKPGDEVMYSGALGRSGTNAQYSVVDSRIVGRKPKGWGWAETAGLPLVGLTAWEMLEGHFNLKPFQSPSKEETLLIVNGAGGVGSIATQLAARVFKIKSVIVTASRKETRVWAKRNGATHVINHHEALGPQLEQLGLKPTLAFICHDTQKYLEPIVKLMSPWGRIGSIVETDSPLNFHTMDAFGKALSFHWEFMLAKPANQFDLATQGRMLNDLTKAVEDGDVTSLVTVKEVLSQDSLQRMHRLIEGGVSMGKVVFEVQDTIREM